MKPSLRTLLLIILIAGCFTGNRSHAQATDPGLIAATNLLKDAVKPQADGSHNALLLGLREFEDPALLPLFNALSGSPYLLSLIHI